MYEQTRFEQNSFDQVMHDRNYLLDAIDTVLAWDIPDEALSEAISAQAGLMAGFGSD